MTNQPQVSDEGYGAAHIRSVRHIPFSISFKIHVDNQNM